MAYLGIFHNIMLGNTSKCHFTVKFFLPPVVFLQTFFVSKESTTENISQNIIDYKFNTNLTNLFSMLCHALRSLEGPWKSSGTTWSFSCLTRNFEMIPSSRTLMAIRRTAMSILVDSLLGNSGWASMQRILHLADLRRQRETATWCWNCCFDASWRVYQSWRLSEFARAPRQCRREELYQKPSPSCPKSHRRVCCRWECRPRSQRIDP